MKLIIHYLKNYKKMFLLNVVSVLGFALVELGIPTIVAQMIDNGVNRGDPAYIWKRGVLIAALSVAVTIFRPLSPEISEMIFSGKLRNSHTVSSTNSASRP